MTGYVVKDIRGGKEDINGPERWENNVPRISAELKDLALFEDVVPAGKKIEQDPSGHCQKFEIFNLVKYF